MSRLAQVIQQLSGTHLKNDVSYMEAEVVSVDLSTRSCVVQSVSGNDAVNIENVSLMAAVDDGFLLVPAVGSIVFIAHSTYEKPFICLFSEIEKVIIVTGGISIEVDSNGVVFNDGSLGGMVKVESIVQRLNLIESKVNSIITAYNAHTHPSNGSPTASIIAGTLSSTSRGDIENEKIKQ